MCQGTPVFRLATALAAVSVVPLRGAGFTCPAGECVDNRMTDEEEDAILGALNQARKAALSYTDDPLRPAADLMPPLTWDAELARFAQ
eukprot:gene6935-6600_t